MSRHYLNLCTLLIIGISLPLAGCRDHAATSINDAIKQMAPKGGSGIKRYYYESGELKEETHWKKFKVIDITYYSKGGEPIFTCVFDEKKALQIDLNDDGEITSIFQSVNYTKDGYCFVIENGILQKIQLFNKEGEIISEYPINLTVY